MGNPFEDFTATEKRNVMIYMAGIMLYKFGLEAFTGSITLLATDLFKAENRFSNLAVLQGLNQAFQCVGSIAIAPLIRRFPTRSVLSASIFLFGLLSAIIIIIDVSTGGRIPENGVKRHGQWNSVILFPIYSIIGICHGMVELIRRVIPRDIVGGDVIKLKRMDAIVHVFYEIAGTAGAFFSTFLILKLGNAIAPAMTPFLFILSSVAWSFIGLLEADHDNRRRLETLEEHSLLRQIGHGFAHFGQSVVLGVKIIFSSRKFIWLIPGYSIPLFTHRYLESQLSPAFAKNVLMEGAYAQIMVGGSNFGELLGALFVLFFAKIVKTPIPWLRLDALGLLIVWVLPYAYPAKENALTFAWTLAAIWIPVSFGWAAGDVSLAAYIQSALSKMENPNDKVSPLGAVMAFLYSFYIILYAVLGPVLGGVVDYYFNNNNKDIHPALLRVGGIMYSVVCVILLLATFIPKGSFALNPNLIDDTQIEDEEEEYRKQQALQHDEIKEIKTQQHEVKA
ncbi:major facilitator superfamily domain-containing protein [Linnemannia elongata]|nr:major facilitator superfamily domain-containing protein [Linnemannia elongata]